LTREEGESEKESEGLTTDKEKKIGRGRRKDAHRQRDREKYIERRNFLTFKSYIRQNINTATAKIMTR
jgi:hypothetical protein